MGGLGIANSRDFSAEFDEGGDSKNRCRFAEKVGSGKCWFHVHFSVCGEVAERLKAAVC
jgi:hypothetical protein